MKFSFDKYNRLETPNVTLCELNKQPIASLVVSDLKGEFNYNDISSISFVARNFINQEEYKHFDDIKELRLIHLENFGYFQLEDVERSGFQKEQILECTAHSAQVMFQRRRVSGIKGEYKLYDLIYPEQSAMTILLQVLPMWKIGNVDPVFLTRQRSLDIKEQDLYSLMTKDFYESYQAIFVFDYEKFEINIYDAMREFKDSKIYLDYNNLLKEVDIKVNTDKIYTNISITGGNNLSIQGVTPSESLFNVDYFKDRMSDNLRIRLEAYQQKYNIVRPQYEDIILNMKTANEQLTTLRSNSPKYDLDFNANQDGTAKLTPALDNNSGLSELESLYKALDNVKQVRMRNGNIPYSDVNNIMSNVNSMISSKQSQINTLQSNISNYETQLLALRESLKLTNPDNFSSAEWIELSAYLIDYNDNDKTFLITDIMTQDEKQQVQNELYKYNLNVLNKSCYPKYDFEISAVNFLALKEYEMFQKEFELGVTFTLNIDDKYVIKPLLLGVTIDFENPSDFNLTYGNRTNREDGFDLTPLTNAVNVGSALSFELLKLEAMSQKTDAISELISGSLELINTNLLSDKNKKEVLIDELGIRTREYDYNTDKLLGNEIWINGKQIAFSTDNWKTTRMAIGEMPSPSVIGGSTYGIIADAIVGKILAGNNLYITTENNSLTVDKNGTYIRNGFLEITKGTNTIKLDPTEGFTIYKGSEKQVYIGTDGNVYFKGEINGGSININNRFTVSSSGYMVATDALIRGTIESSTFKGGSININDRFIVNSSGSVTITTGSIDLGSGNARIDSSGYARFRNVEITDNSRVQLGNYGSGGTGVRVDSDGRLYARGAVIDGDGIFSGTVYAGNVIVGGKGNGKISADLLEVNKITSLTNSNNYLIIGGGSYADINWYANGTRNFNIQQYSGSDFQLNAGNNNVFYTQGGTTITSGNWLFSRNATFDGNVNFRGSVSGLNLTATFA